MTVLAADAISITDGAIVVAAETVAPRLGLKPDALQVEMQRGQVCCTAKMPWLMRTCPEPWQASQVTGACPRAAPEPPHSVHSFTVWKSISVEVPNTACSRSSASS